MVATKELVGEQYHIHGLAMPHARGMAFGVHTRTESIRLQEV